jgi:hypothetical protein
MCKNYPTDDKETVDASLILADPCFVCVCNNPLFFRGHTVVSLATSCRCMVSHSSPRVLFFMESGRIVDRMPHLRVALSREGS